jgi:hypothetical protein
MLYRETNEDEYKDDGSLKSKSYLAPQCIPMKIQGKKAFFNHSQGCFTENPVKQALPAGGILADEMGLGMFLCNVALVDWWTNESIL